jgi:hypothetical protein
MNDEMSLYIVAAQIAPARVDKTISVLILEVNREVNVGPNAGFLRVERDVRLAEGVSLHREPTKPLDRRRCLELAQAVALVGLGDVHGEQCAAEVGLCVEVDATLGCCGGAISAQDSYSSHKRR